MRSNGTQFATWRTRWLFLWQKLQERIIWALSGQIPWIIQHSSRETKKKHDFDFAPLGNRTILKYNSHTYSILAVKDFYLLLANPLLLPVGWIFIPCFFGVVGVGSSTWSTTKDVGPCLSTCDCTFDDTLQAPPGGPCLCEYGEIDWFTGTQKHTHGIHVWYIYIYIYIYLPTFGWMYIGKHSIHRASGLCTKCKVYENVLDAPYIELDFAFRKQNHRRYVLFNSDQRITLW